MATLIPWYVTSLIREGKLLVHYGFEGDVDDATFEALDEVSKDLRRKVLDEKKRRKAI